MAAPWSGHATAAGTAKFAAGVKAAAPGHFRQHPIHYTGVEDAAMKGTPAQLTLSSLGVGTYLGATDAATDAAVTNAVIKTVAEGWNVIDTAANYRSGRAELSVGQALQALRVMGGAERSELFISTKAGYPAGDHILEKLFRAGTISPSDVVGGVHCMHPNYLKASLEHSLASLGLETVDLLYLHNPAESQLVDLGQQAFMERLRAAFEFLEGARTLGQIKAYGIATWSCFRAQPGDEHLSLESVVELAKEVGSKDHGFRYIQLPINVGMTEAWAQPWQEVGGRRMTLMQAAAELGIGVFSSGPLMEAELLSDFKLADVVRQLPELTYVQGNAPRLLQLARSTPGLLTSLVGHKTSANVEANCALTKASPLSESQFHAAFKVLTPDGSQ